MQASDRFHYRLLFEASNKGIILASADGTISAANAAACRTLRRTQEQLVGSHLAACWDPADPRTQVAWQEQSTRGEFTGELLLFRAGRTPFLAEVSLIGHENSAGEESVGIIFRDISGRQRPPGDAPVGDEDPWRSSLRASSSAVPAGRREAATQARDSAAYGPSRTDRARGRAVREDLGSDRSSSSYRTTPESLLAKLTPRETQVLYMLSLGASNSQIAQRLVISPGTVKLHVHRIITKLQVSGRTQAAVVAVRSGIFGSG